MTSSIDEFRQANRKIVRLPEGDLEVEIRRVWQIDMVGNGELPLPQADSQPTDVGDKPSESDSQRTIIFCRRLILAGAVKPRMTDSEEEAIEGKAVYVRELSQANFYFLATEILNFSGAGQEVAREADTFRPDAIGKNGKGAGGEVRQAADGGPEHGSGEVLPKPGDHLPRDSEEPKKP